MTTDTAADDAGRRDALAERLFRSMIESNELASVWLGLRLNLYEILHDQGPATVADLAERAGIDDRYAREWLEQQAVAGLLDVEDATQDAGSRRYRLPTAHADVLLDADHPAHAGATAYWIGSLAEVLPRIPGIYRSGEGLPYPEYGADCRLAIANFNRPMFVNPARHGPAGRGPGGHPGPAGRRRGGGRGRREGRRDLHRPGDDVERLNFGFSWWHCLPASRAETPSVAVGTALRPATVREWSGQAGFGSLRVLPVEHEFWRFYELSG